MADTTFTDAAGRVWDVALNLGAARRVDKSDFSELTDEPFSIINAKKETFAVLLSNPSLLFAIIWAVVQPQAKKMYRRLHLDFGDKIDKDSPPDQVYGNMNPEQRARYFPFDPDTEEAQLEFATGITGSVKEAGTEAFWRSLGDFFPDLETALFMMMQQYKRGKQKLSEKVANSGKEIQDLLDQQVETDYKTMMANIQSTLALKRGVTSTE